VEKRTVRCGEYAARTQKMRKEKTFLAGKHEW